MLTKRRLRRSSRYCTDQRFDDPRLARTTCHLNDAGTLATCIHAIDLAGSQRWVFNIVSAAGVHQIPDDQPAREGLCPLNLQTNESHINRQHKSLDGYMSDENEKPVTFAHVMAPSGLWVARFPMCR